MLLLHKRQGRGLIARNRRERSMTCGLDWHRSATVKRALEAGWLALAPLQGTHPLCDQCACGCAVDLFSGAERRGGRGVCWQHAPQPWNDQALLSPRVRLAWPCVRGWRL